MQLNKGSVLGGFGRRAQHTAHYLMDHNLVSFVASDTHGINRRTPYLLDAYQYIAGRYSKEYADNLFIENPLRVRDDLELIKMKPMWNRMRYH